MQIGYSCIAKQLSRNSKQLALMLGLIAVPVSLRMEAVTPAPNLPVLEDSHSSQSNSSISVDPRTVRLRKFLASLHCPVTNFAEDFIQAADDNQLDWRLLPSISVIESSGGKAYRNNNIFGWENGDRPFPTLRTGIHQVAFWLGKGPIYRNLDVEAKLKLYNRDLAYPGNVMSVMNRISPVLDLKSPKSARLVAATSSESSD